MSAIIIVLAAIEHCQLTSYAWKTQKTSFHSFISNSVAGYYIHLELDH